MAVASRAESWRQGLNAELAAAWLPGLATFLVVIAIGAAGGGLRTTVWRLVTVALLAIVAAALVGRERVEVFGRELVAIGLLAALTAWAALSTVWSITPPASTIEGERVLLYLAALTAVVIGVERRSLRPAVAGALGGVTVVCAVGLVEHYLTDRPLNPVEGKLLVEPFGYANALGMYATLGILLSLGFVLSARTNAARAVAAAPCLVLVPTLLLTSSRGALAALALGAAATLYFGRVLPTRLLVPLAVIGVAAGLLLGANRGQLGSITGENRPHYWHVALYDYADHPVLGSGAGTFGDYFWRYHRPPEGFTRLAHSLYLETLAELGPLGLALLAGALVLPLALVRGRQTPLVAAVAGAYTAFLAHAAIDWDWTVTALTTAAVFCGGATLVGTRRGPIRPISPLAFGLVLLGASGLAAFSLLRL